MKYAVIAHDQTLNALGLWTRGYQFALGQKLITSDGSLSTYADFYKRAKMNGCFTIVDNGAAEAEDEPMSFSKLVYAAEYIDADEIVLPDVLRNSEETLRRTCDTTVLRMVPPRRRMIVPQGDSWQEWTACLKDMRLFLGDDFATIGLPKHLERLSGGRGHALSHIVEHGLHLRHHVHLLGVWAGPHEELSRLKANRNWVRGIDTGRPIACAQTGSDIWQSASLKWEPLSPDLTTLAMDNIVAMDEIVCQ